MATSFSYTVSSIGSAAELAEVQSPEAINGATAIRDLKVDPVTGDLELSEGDLVFVFGVEGIASDIESAIKTFGPGQPPDGDFEPGEWFLDTSIGVNYWGAVLRGSVNKTDAEQAFVSEVLKRPGVVDVVNVVSTLSDREFSLSFDVITDLGKMISAVLTETLGEGVEGEVV